MKYLLLIHQGDAPTPRDSYHHLHATRAELLRRLDRMEDARAAYTRALELVHTDTERRFLEGRLADLGGSVSSSQ
jgi:predicted RNA polymerase sigma factor